MRGTQISRLGRLALLLATLGVLFGSIVFAKEYSGSPYVKLKPLQSEPPLRFGNKKQLFVDNHVLCAWGNVKRVQGKLQKHPENPLLKPDAAWEETARKSWGIQLGTAVYDADAKHFKMWYQIEQHTSGNVAAYAYSKDGVKWVKPHLGLVEYAGTMKNNVLRHVDRLGKRPLEGSIYLIVDPRERPQQRKYLSTGIPVYHDDGTKFGGWAGMGYSSDGLTWHSMPGGLRTGAGGGNASIVWDQNLQKYVLFHRQLTEQADRETIDSERYVVRQESEELIDWSPRQTVFNPMMDERRPEVESMRVYLYEGFYLGIPSMLDNLVHGDVEQHLIISRDGYRWDYPFPDEAFIPKGKDGQWDDNVVWFPCMIVHNNKMLFYYGGARYRHNVNGESLDKRQIKIGMGWVPLDRLMGLQTRKRMDGKGALLTRPFVVEGDDLYINAEVNGELRVEVIGTTARQVDTGGKAHMGHYIAAGEQEYDGFRRGDCNAVTGNSLAHRVRWNDRSIGHFKGKAVRLRLIFNDTCIWAFQVK